MNMGNSRFLSAAFSYDFRKTIWGMTKLEVKSAERIYPLIEDETHLTYRGNFMSLEAVIGYNFENDCLIECGYIFNEVFQDRSSYMTEYENVERYLSRIYGAP